MGEVVNVYKIVARMLEEKKPCRMWQNGKKMNLAGLVLWIMYWIWLTQDND
jgi:hypothetical protein